MIICATVEHMVDARQDIGWKGKGWRGMSYHSQLHTWLIHVDATQYVGFGMGWGWVGEGFRWI